VVPLTAQVVMLGFFALNVVSVFLLGRRLLDTGAGLLAAFLLSTAPFVVFSLTNFQLDLLLTGKVAFSL
jgi:4-amino-4-deoxy-L-arabinose transferase-like glycosyltransferase